jgi:predicted AAA+ superfamily ATPase
MKAFHTIAIPDKDILEGKLTMDVFAADLWEAYSGRAPQEYRDPYTFFKKTYLTAGLKNVLGVVQKRLKGAGGDPVIQIQTPFGGGKTHALIAMYHKAKEWKAKTAVVVGTVLGAEETVWGTIEKQLTGSVKLLTGNVSPGRDKIRKVLEKNEPVLILMDEILEYAIKASGVKVGESTLAAQTIAFIQELTEVAGTVEKTCVVLTLARSSLEHFDEKGEKLYQELQKRAGREEKVYTPVEENEITRVIRQRLFSSVDEVGAKKIVSEFMDYAEKEEILPIGKESSDYRTRFLESYPFSPEVVQVLYERWGSLPTFQRTRGVLRLLSLVIYSLRESSRPYITLSDFDLAESEIRRELIKHIGNEFDGVISSDISGSGSGSKLVDKSLGRAYQGLTLGSRASISTFLYSFSGGVERGAHLGEIKRSATTTENPASVVAEAVEQLKNKLFFLQSQNDKYFFSNQPNLNRILLTKMENIKDSVLVDAERDLLKQEITSSRLKAYVWPQKPKDVPDNSELKLVVLADKNEETMKEILSTKGETPRVFRNTVLFLTCSEAERSRFVEQAKRKIAFQQIEADRSLTLSEEQRKEVKSSVKREEENLRDGLRRLYRLVYIPSKDGLRELDIGIPTYGERKSIDEEVYEKLRVEQEILEKVSPLVIKEKYLRDKDYVKTSQIYDSMVKTPGERRTIGNGALEQSFNQGVKQGLFGLGELQVDGVPLCRLFKEDIGTVSFAENEVLIRDVICVAQRDKPLEATLGPHQVATPPVPPTGEPSPTPTQEKKASVREQLDLRFPVPMGKVSQIMGMMNFLQTKFKELEIEIKAKNGSISEDDFANKIKEALRQLGILLDE